MCREMRSSLYMRPQMVLHRIFFSKQVSGLAVVWNFQYVSAALFGPENSAGYGKMSEEKSKRAPTTPENGAFHIVKLLEVRCQKTLRTH